MQDKESSKPAPQAEVQEVQDKNQLFQSLQNGMIRRNEKTKSESFCFILHLLHQMSFVNEIKRPVEPLRAIFEG